jgi:lipopolysaccharide export LptBFGC system permease protein LptF
MVAMGFVLAFFNFIVIFFCYIVINHRLEKKLINKDVLKSIKEEMNSIILKLNETTLNNISIIEEKKRELDKLVILADKKKSGLKISISKNDDFDNNLFATIQDKSTYNPHKISMQNKISKEIVKETNENKNSQDDELKDLSIIDKAKYLLNKGVHQKEIQRMIGISSGELELILEMENLKK